MPGINVRGSRLTFDAFGAGNTVVALHASATSGRQWHGLAQHLQRQHCIFTPDLPGHGGSTAVTGTDGPSAWNVAETAFGLIEAWDEPVHLVGAGFGGSIALRIAMKHPDRVYGLTLIEPAEYHVLQGQSDTALLGDIRHLHHLMRTAAKEGRAHEAMARFTAFWEGEQVVDLAGPEHVARQATQLIADLDALQKEPPTFEDYRRIKVPALVIMGTESPLASQRTAEIVAGALGDTRLQLVMGTSHTLSLTAGETVNRLTARHIQAVNNRLSQISCSMVA